MPKKTVNKSNTNQSPTEGEVITHKKLSVEREKEIIKWLSKSYLPALDKQLEQGTISRYHYDRLIRVITPRLVTKARKLMK